MIKAIIDLFEWLNSFFEVKCPNCGGVMVKDRYYDPMLDTPIYNCPKCTNDFIAVQQNIIWTPLDET